MKALKKVAFALAAVAAFGFVSCSSDDDSDYDDNLKLVVLANSATTWKSEKTEESSNSTITKSVVYEFKTDKTYTSTSTQVFKVTLDNKTSTVTSKQVETGKYSGYTGLDNHNFTITPESVEMSYTDEDEKTTYSYYDSESKTLKSSKEPKSISIADYYKYLESTFNRKDYSVSTTALTSGSKLIVKTTTSYKQGSVDANGNTKYTDENDDSLEEYTKQ